MTDSAIAGAHPIVACARGLNEGLDGVRHAEPVFLSTSEKAEALLALQRVQDRAAALQLAVLAASDDLAESVGSRDPAQWLAHHARLDGSATRRDQALACALDRHCRHTGGALRDGAITVGHARVIVRVLGQLRDEVDPDVLERAEKHLVHLAGDYSPRQLKVLGRKVLEVVAPEIAEEHERRALEKEEREARRRIRYVARPQGDGTTVIRARVPDALARRLDTYLQAFTNPRRCRSTVGAATRELQPYQQRLGRAFCSFLESFDPDRLPVHGGRATTVVVTVPLESLRDGVGTAITATGEALSPGEIRRLACTADLLPAVLGGASEPLDLGRTSRLFSRVQRIAMVQRDKHCRAEGCDIPAAWTEAHHLHPWSAGGNTNLADGVLVCAHHHHLLHDPAYQHTRLPNGDIRFHRRV